jgi:DnaJ-class molecular chaperone
MAINFSRYKTYDTADGYGSASDWRKGFKARMGSDEAIEILGKYEETPYDILGVTKQSTQAEIKKAFRMQITEWHPDKNPDNILQAEEMSKKIIAAYTYLKQ